MSDSPIQIGPISLQDFEIPQFVRFGGRHRLTVHSLSDGRRIIETLGPDDNDILFQGTFSGSNAESRARAFDNLRLSGAVVWLTWQSFKRQVILKNFEAIYHNPWWISYKVSCTVVMQLQAATTQAANLFAIISSDLNCALSVATTSGISLASLKNSIYTSNALVAGTSDQLQAATAAESAFSAIDDQIMNQSIQFSSPIVLNKSPKVLSTLYVAKVNLAGMLAATVNVRSYVSRIGVSLQVLEP